MRIGVISDTHGYFDPGLKQALAGVELILHAGDVGSEEVLEELREIGPVHAVRGNVDSPESNLPLSLKLNCGHVQVEMMHVLSVPQSQLEEWAGRASPGGTPPLSSRNFLRTFHHSTCVVLFGHSHQPCLAVLGCRLFFNPGSAGKRRFSLPRCWGLLETSPDGIQASIELLERYNGSVPPPIQMNFEE